MDDTLDTPLSALTPEAIARLKLLHPAFEPAVGRAMGVPDGATIGELARAANLPESAVLATARGVIGVPELCGCGKCGTGAGAAADSTPETLH